MLDLDLMKANPISLEQCITDLVVGNIGLKNHIIRLQEYIKELQKSDNAYMEIDIFEQKNKELSIDNKKLHLRNNELIYAYDRIANSNHKLINEINELKSRFGTRGHRDVPRNHREKSNDGQDKANNGSMGSKQT